MYLFCHKCILQNFKIANSYFFIKYLGLVGKSWAMIFASAGYKVTLYDILESQVSAALTNIASELVQFEKDGVIRGTISAADQTKLISGSSNLSDCIKDCVYVQECVPENLELKMKVWGQIDEFVDNENAILASSSSCIVPSKISPEMKHKEQFIVAHPVNPPYHAPMVELVPASVNTLDYLINVYTWSGLSSRQDYVIFEYVPVFF